MLILNCFLKTICKWECPYTLLGFNILPSLRLAYFGSRYDSKARMQCNFFERWYKCKHLCEHCMPQRPTKRSDVNMNYQNFKEDCPRYMTYLTDEDYRKTATQVSPWAAMQGWHLRTCFYDMMHTVYLGVGRDLASNILADLIVQPSVLEPLKKSSVELAWKCTSASRMNGFMENLVSIWLCYKFPFDWFGSLKFYLFPKKILAAGSILGLFRPMHQQNQGLLAGKFFSHQPTLAGETTTTLNSEVCGKLPM